MYRRKGSSLHTALGVAAALAAAFLLAPVYAAQSTPGTTTADATAPSPAIASLAHKLTAETHSEAAKVTAIYRWMAHNITYDTSTSGTNLAPDSTPETVLKNRCSRCKGYSRLFEALCQASGLDAVVLAGQAKGVGYTAGSRLAGTPNHAWNAVKVEGEWRLVDCTWGAGYVSQRHEFVPAYTEHYLMTPPEVFIADHFPQDPRWQLLPHPVVRDTFEDSVFFRPPFFALGLGMESQAVRQVVDNGMLEVSFKTPADVVLCASVFCAGRELPGQYALAQREGASCTVQAAFPAAGRYVVRVFGKRKGDPDSYECAVEIPVEARSGVGEQAGFPQVLSAFNERGIILRSPLKGRLDTGKSADFRLEAPGAEQVAVLVGEQWSFLTRDGDWFRGDVPVGAGAVRVVGKYPGKENCEVLLQYNSANP